VTVIGWTGSATTLTYILIMHPIFEDLARTHRFKLRIIGEAPAYPKVRGAEVENLQWRASTEPEDLMPLDIGVMPLSDDEWSRGKCGAKALQYMALGIATICSPVGVNRDIVQHGVNGFLASTPDEWLARLRELLDDVELRRRLGSAARKTVEQRFSASSQ